MKLKLFVAAAFGVLLSLVIFTFARAHHPIITFETDCRDDGTWSVNWVLRADADRDLTWEVVFPDGYSPSGAQDDSQPFRRHAVYPVSVESVTEWVSVSWSNGAFARASATATRPEACVAPTTTVDPTTTTVVDPTTTTVVDPTTTTTTVVDPTTTTTTVVDPTTTTVVDPTTTTTVVDQGTPPTTTTQPVRNAPVVQPASPTPMLPATGGNGFTEAILAVGLIFVVCGSIMWISYVVRKDGK